MEKPDFHWIHIIIVTNYDRKKNFYAPFRCSTQRSGLSDNLWGFILDLCLFVSCFPAFFDLLISLGQ